VTLRNLDSYRGRVRLSVPAFYFLAKKNRQKIKELHYNPSRRATLENTKVLFFIARGAINKNPKTKSFDIKITKLTALYHNLKL
jgi:hypothetical protein